MQRIAIPIQKEMLSEYVSSCSHFMVYSVEGCRIVDTEKLEPSYTDLMTIPQWLRNKGITDLITQKLDRSILNHFSSLKVNLFVGIDIKHPSDIIKKWLEGKICSDQKIIEEINNKIKIKN